ncbi:MAG: prolyl oligopeptidase family serine peptidase, partial [bacterium]|nr:prolyl oligopeptidase family serine peptidase [bacterium]
QEVGFSSVTLTLLDRGFIFAMAHIRGGGDLGEEWHQAAVGLKKKTTFTDFIACSEYLVNEKYTSSPKLIIEGGSAGGMLMGVLLNMRPDLFGVVIASIPALDYLNAMLYPELYGIINYYEEWGDPSDKEVFEYLLSYCPYRNIERKDYPTILVISSYNDARVKYWSPTKWVAKMRDYKTDDNLLLLKTKMGIGHVGSSGRYNVYKDIAFEYAFMLWMMGIKE